MLKPLDWQSAQGVLRVLDQRQLPARSEWLDCDSPESVSEAIHCMAVRGAPAIGIAGAWGAVLAARAAAGETDWRACFQSALQNLGRARPTAVNLAWALGRMRGLADTASDSQALAEACEVEAARIEREDLAANQRIGELGARLLPKGSRVLTHCNTGALATGGHGTALGIIRSAWSQGLLAGVYATETRPWLQGSRLTAWELSQEGIAATLLVDSAAASLMGAGEIDAVVIGADRITRRGDVANKIGSYMLAVCARAHEIPFIVAAPGSTVDSALLKGSDIPIENRSADEIWWAAGLDKPMAGITTHNPAFDITPAELVTAIVTEEGIASPMNGQGMALLERSDSGSGHS
ncbi:methylthioribose-1-phosphate isomerase [Natronospira proteinivora]|uniref:Methylthioribose-1-phosphate isomerase n=1 Tax=Natronospira proteinivora TaxID=1807133 RepID=A0ABT1G6K0_9GAMM|nr:S-methyl-5-thioribose-1-phosphate isomerase [Natronospira proteinivora]MCP1726934.1 methylthioribose-1-phosphate isomerase [Natronospira proteinivora]